MTLPDQVTLFRYEELREGCWREGDILRLRSVRLTSFPPLFPFLPFLSLLYQTLPLISLLLDSDLCRLASLPPAGVICELVKADDPNGDMARRDDCFAFAREWGLKMISIEQLEEYRRVKGL
jgi:hypothetical protein